MRAGRFVLVADRGGLTPAALRVQFAALSRQAAINQHCVPLVVVATTSERRIVPWRAMSELAIRRNRGLLTVDVATWADWERRARSNTARTAPAYSWSPPLPLSARGAADEQVPRLDLGVIEHGIRSWDLDPGERAVVDVVGRHPFVSTTSLADVLSEDATWVERRAARLVRRGLATRLPVHEIPPEIRRQGARFEQTCNGLQVLAAYLGLRLPSAVRYHGLAGGGAAAPVGARRTLLRNLRHTLGADEVFAAIARAMQPVPGGALLEWLAAGGSRGC